MWQRWGCSVAVLQSCSTFTWALFGVWFLSVGVCEDVRVPASLYYSHRNIMRLVLKRSWCVVALLNIAVQCLLSVLRFISFHSRVDWVWLAAVVLPAIASCVCVCVCVTCLICSVHSYLTAKKTLNRCSRLSLLIHIAVLRRCGLLLQTE